MNETKDKVQQMLESGVLSQRDYDQLVQMQKEAQEVGIPSDEQGRDTSSLSWYKKLRRRTEQKGQRRFRWNPESGAVSEEIV